MNDFEPRIVAFLCNWCAYAGADLAGVSRLQYPANIRIVRVMCTGRIDPVILLEMLANGADGVLILGCHPGDCHYLEGNYQAEIKIGMLKKLMRKTGLEVERLHLEWVSASEGLLFSEIVKEFTEQVKNLGPSPLSGEKPDSDLLAKILAAKISAEDFRLRAMVGREKKLIEEGNVYGEKMTKEEFDQIIEDVIDAEYLRQKIYLLVKNEPLSVKELSKRLEIDPQIILRHVVVMKKRGLIGLDKIQNTSPLYTALEVG
jgi:coenzyme F420-reducing hydrogenase delta subunit